MITTEKSYYDLEKKSESDLEIATSELKGEQDKLQKISKKLISKEYPNTNIFMSDINYEMLDEGRNRAIDESFSRNCHFCQLSGEELPFKDNTFDVITVGFGLRNFTDKEKGLKEMKRCLKTVSYTHLTLPTKA